MDQFWDAFGEVYSKGSLLQMLPLLKRGGYTPTTAITVNAIHNGCSKQGFGSNVVTCVLPTKNLGKEWLWNTWLVPRHLNFAQGLGIIATQPWPRNGEGTFFSFLYGSLREYGVPWFTRFG